MSSAKKYSLFVFLFATAFLFVHNSFAAVLFELSKIGVPYDIYQDRGTRTGFYSIYPQYSGIAPIFPGGGVAYNGTADWLRVKRISGVSCDMIAHIHIYSTDGLIQIGNVIAGAANGPYCDFPITGPDRTNMAVGYIGMCANQACDGGYGPLVLDGSPENAGYISDGTQTIWEKGGWAFQLCDSGGCSGGFASTTSTSTTSTSTPPTATSTPPGASNILFLPGIMGSRLYEDSAECASVMGTQQRWFSTSDCDQLRLKTDFTGRPLYPLYTKPTEASVIRNIFVLSPLYGDFLDRLASEKTKGTIADYRAVPYDWRLKLEDILKTKEDNGKVVLDENSTYKDSYLYHSLQSLLASSKSGKVTIVAHSNGGLVAKALLLEMKAQNDPLLEKIDNLILVAVPQEGTPDAVVSILHGTDLGGGLVLSKKVARQIVNTAPFAHNLLPSEHYFSGTSSSVQTPVIKIEPGSVTDAWRAQFGAEITTRDGMRNFMSKDSGRPKPATDDLLHPEVVDNYLLNNADTVHVAQSSFVPPATMKVSQVGGTGVSTISSLTYFTDKECISRSVFSFFMCTQYRDKLGYRAIPTYDGDGTVVLPSALTIPESGQVKRVWLALDKYNENNSGREHRNILEVSDIQNFILNTVEATTSRQYSYLSTQEVVPSGGSRLVFQLHSPLDMWVSTKGGIVSSSTIEVANAVYRQLGELQYISVPATENAVQVHLIGQKTGSFTLEAERWSSTTLLQKVAYIAVPTATGTKATADVSTTLANTVLKLDNEGDGIVDAAMNTKGDVTIKQVTYPILTTSIEKLALDKSLKQALLVIIKDAAYYADKKPSLSTYRKLEDLLLDATSVLIKLYTNKRYISGADSKILLDMVKVLKDKQ
jgi:pimeloyl-ACP methyl ester carboxylesterase